jgi:hypothetical protein
MSEKASAEVRCEGRFRYSDLKEASSGAMGFEWGLVGRHRLRRVGRAINGEVTAAVVGTSAKIRLVFSAVADESEHS